MCAHATTTTQRRRRQQTTSSEALARCGAALTLTAGESGESVATPAKVGLPEAIGDRPVVAANKRR